MPTDPYKVPRPAVISFSGGRSSGYMLGRIVEAHGGRLPADIHAVFANTGKEHPRTLDFVQRCSTEWGVEITWLEYDWNQPLRYRIVNHNSAARNGEPYEALIARKGFLPNAHIRFCTSFLKRDPIRRHAFHTLGLSTHTAVIGFRADEGRRVMRMLASCKDGPRAMGEYVALPMVDAGVREPDVKAWWAAQTFDLDIPTEAGNCDLCFLKSRRKLMRLIRAEPAAADWWVQQEARVKSLVVPGRDADRAYMRFRENETETYDRLRAAALAQGDFFTAAPDGADDRDCACTD